MRVSAHGGGLDTQSVVRPHDGMSRAFKGGTPRQAPQTDLQDIVLNETSRTPEAEPCDPTPVRSLHRSGSETPGGRTVEPGLGEGQGVSVSWGQSAGGGRQSSGDDGVPAA